MPRVRIARKPITSPTSADEAAPSSSARPHGLQEVGPGVHDHESVRLPLGDQPLLSRHLGSVQIYSGLRADMLDGDKIPRVTILVAQDDSFRVGMLRVRLLQPFLQFLGLPGSSFDDEDVVTVGSLASRGGIGLGLRLLGRQARDRRRSEGRSSATKSIYLVF